MTNLLIDEPPLQVLRSLACLIGLNEALVLQQLHYLTRRAGGPVEMAVDDLRAHQFPFWSEATIRRTLRSLKDKKLVLVTQPKAYDRTNVYAVNYEELDRVSPANAPRGQIDRMEAVTLTGSKRSERPDGSGHIDRFTREERDRGTAEVPLGSPALRLVSDPVDAVLAELDEVAAARSVALPERAAIQKLLTDFPEADVPAVAREVAFWLLHGKGKGRGKPALAGTLRTWLRRDATDGRGPGTVAPRQAQQARQADVGAMLREINNEAARRRGEA